MTGRVAALERLRLRLAAAEKHAGSDVSDLQRQRECCYMAVKAAKALLVETGIDDSRLAAPFEWLMVALNDVHNGLTAPLFVPVREGGQPPHPVEVRVLRGQVAAVQVFLSKEGKRTREEAAKEVFDGLGEPAVNRLHYQQKRSGADMKPVSWRTVLRWRDNTSEAAKDSLEREGFRRMEELLASQAPSDPLAVRAKRQIDHIAAVVPEFIHPRNLD